MRARAVIPELQVTDLAASLAFYTRVLGFTVAYSRPEERFAMLEREDAALMLEQAGGPGRRITATPLERPFGRGLNLQILVSDVDALAAAVQGAGHALFIALEEAHYRTDRGVVVQRQFVVADPDGYLLRFANVRSLAPARTPS
jgi:catechol 2,3-dioxygenase-like lactoylglutathione lyase family enzyme